MTDQVDINELITQVHEGNFDAFEVIVISYRRFVFKVFHTYRINFDDWDDLAQDVWVKFYLTISARPEVLRAGPKAYLRRIAERNAIDYLRRQKQFAESLPDDELSQFIDENQTTRLDLFVDTKTVIEQIKQLPLPQQQAMLLVDAEGYTYEETALILGVPIGSVKGWVFRGRKAVRDFFEGDKRNK